MFVKRAELTLAPNDCENNWAARRPIARRAEILFGLVELPPSLVCFRSSTRQAIRVSPTTMSFGFDFIAAATTSQLLSLSKAHLRLRNLSLSLSLGRQVVIKRQAAIAA